MIPACLILIKLHVIKMQKSEFTLIFPILMTVLKLDRLSFCLNNSTPQFFFHPFHFGFILNKIFVRFINNFIINMILIGP